MNTVTVTGDTLVVEPTGLDKLWSLTRRIVVPLAHVRGATLDPGASFEPKGLRAPGLAVPGKYAGTFYRDGDRMFWNIRRGTDTVVIELEGERFRRLVLSVEQPRAVVARVNAAVQAG